MSAEPLPRMSTSWRPRPPEGVARCTLTVIGDARIEFRTTLPDLTFPQLVENCLVYADIGTTVAGTAVNLARQATRYFARVNVIAKVGDDPFTPMIAEHVRQAGAEPILHVAAGTANGVTLVIRDRAGGRPIGTRLLVAGRPAPSELLSPADIRACADLLAASDIVVCDGYSLLSATSEAALREVLRLVRRGRRPLCLDVVPHDIDGRLEPRRVRAWLAAADIVIIEGRTLARLFGAPLSPRCTREEVLALLPHVPATAGRRPLWLIRYGPDGMNDTLVYRAGDICRAYPTGYADEAEPMGFGDRLAAAELSWWLARTES